MKLVIFGLTLSSSWGNGHATLWRGLVRALSRAGHEVVFFERDVDYYARHRDMCEIERAQLVLYSDWESVVSQAEADVSDCDAALVTSYCPDARAASLLLSDAPRPPTTVFYDLDTPVTLGRLRAGESVPYLPDDGLSQFDLVLSYAGGAALDELQQRLGARQVAALYGHADPEAHFPLVSGAGPAFDLSYLGTYARDRQRSLESLFIAPARRRRAKRFVLGGAGYPPDFPWQPNIWFRQHVPPAAHPEFFSASRLTLNVTRAEMAQMGYCPSGRLFEAAACGVLVVTDEWQGIGQFYAPGSEIVVARDTSDVLAALDMPAAQIGGMAAKARERTLDEHTSAHRARELVALIENAASSPTLTSRPPLGARSGPLFNRTGE